jgi:hypothetical protein
LGLKWPALTYGSVPQLEFSGTLSLRRAPLGASREIGQKFNIDSKKREDKCRTEHKLYINYGREIYFGVSVNFIFILCFDVLKKGNTKTRENSSVFSCNFYK